MIGVQGSRVPFVTCDIPPSVGVGTLSVVIQIKRRISAFVDIWRKEMFVFSCYCLTLLGLYYDSNLPDCTHNCPRTIRH